MGPSLEGFSPGGYQMSSPPLGEFTNDLHRVESHPLGH